MLHTQRIAALGLILGIGVSAVLAQNPPVPGQVPQVRTQLTPGQDARISAATAFPTSKLKGLNVRNPQGETLGAIDDLVVNLTDGKVHYVAMSVGGVLGIGDKLFAIPFREMKFSHGKDEMHFVLNISKQRLDNAPGFDKSNWPDFADPQWRDTVDKYYPKSTEERTTRTPPAGRTE